MNEYSKFYFVISEMHIKEQSDTCCSLLSEMSFSALIWGIKNIWGRL